MKKIPGDFCDALHLSVFEKIALGRLALADAENLEMRTSAGKWWLQGSFQIDRVGMSNPVSIISLEV
ncbi:hypothetical protein Q3G72_009833 [Acer saccharum]|nr:hypothetical protein Q3G72_009833 [Acer saccharum]